MAAFEGAVDKNSDHCTNTPACDAVLGTTELLDAILSLLPARDIRLYNQRVCKKWKDAIAASPTIQTKLWLRSPLGEAISPEGTLTDHPLVTNQRLNSRYGNLDFGVMPSTPWYNCDVKPNRFLLTSSWPGYPPPLMTAPTLRDITALTSGLPTWHNITIRNIKPTLSVVQPSWIDMYLTEPPVTTARLSVSLPDPEQRGRSYDYTTASVRDLGGLTFRAVLDVMDKVCQSSACRLAPYYLSDRSRAWCRVEFFCGEANMRDRAAEAEDDEDMLIDAFF